MANDDKVRVIIASKWFTVAQIAERLQKDPRFVYNLIKSNKIEALKIGNEYRIPYPSFAEYVEKQLIG